MSCLENVIHSVHMFQQRDKSKTGNSLLDLFVSYNFGCIYCGQIRRRKKAIKIYESRGTDINQNNHF